MSKKSKSGALGIFLAALVVVASLIFLKCMVNYDRYGHGYGHMDHNEMHGDGAHKMDDHDHEEMHGQGVVVQDAYARVNGASAKAGAAFMVIENHSDEDDRLISATANVSKVAELHTHTKDASGLMVMGPIEGGLAIPAHGFVSLKRGGDHVMMMGLNRSLKQGDMVTLTLTFENKGEVTVEVPVDLTR
jgi:copper(I)-binding protein